MATETYLDAHAPSWKHRRAVPDWINLVCAFPILGELPVNGIVAAHVGPVADRRGHQRRHRSRRA
jgi:hypothetical protein